MRPNGIEAAEYGRHFIGKARGSVVASMRPRHRAAEYGLSAQIATLKSQMLQ